MLVDELPDLVQLLVDVVELGEDQVFRREITDGFVSVANGFGSVHTAYGSSVILVTGFGSFPRGRRAPAPLVRCAAAMISRMAEDSGLAAWTTGERAAAVLAIALALGLLFIGLDVATGGRLTGRGCKGCGDDQPGD